MAHTLSKTANPSRSTDQDAVLFDRDPVLSMLGAGKHLWKQETGDEFVERLRSEEAPPNIQQREHPEQDILQEVWRRIEKHQREEFQTATALPFEYEVEGNGIWFYREGKRINRKLTRTQVNVAVLRCPLASTTEIKDLIDYSYLFALLMDPRIREKAW